MSVRIDKWLWAARFFRTRSAAQQAVEGGKVKLGGERVKPSKDVRIGDELAIQIGAYEWTVRVEGLSDKRGSAPVARTLYSENEARNSPPNLRRTATAVPPSANAGNWNAGARVESK